MVSHQSFTSPSSVIVGEPTQQLKDHKNDLAQRLMIESPAYTNRFRVERILESEGIIAKGEHTPGFCLDLLTVPNRDLRSEGLKVLLLDGATMKGNSFFPNAQPRLISDLEGGLFIEKFPELFIKELEGRQLEHIKFEFADDKYGFDVNHNYTVAEVASSVVLQNSQITKATLLYSFMRDGLNLETILYKGPLSLKYWQLKFSTVNQRAAFVYDKDLFLAAAPIVEALNNANKQFAEEVKRYFVLHQAEYFSGGTFAGVYKLKTNDLLLFSIGDSRAIAIRDGAPEEQTKISSAVDSENRFGVKRHPDGRVLPRVNNRFSFAIVKEREARKSKIVLHTDWINADSFLKGFYNHYGTNSIACNRAMELMKQRELSERKNQARGSKIDDKSFFIFDAKNLY